jgi:thiamine biosynthesis lipoprotein
MKYRLYAFFSLLCILSSCGTEKSQDPIAETRFALGTTCTITVFRKADAHHIQEAFDAVHRVESLMSVNLDDSEISVLNDHAGRDPLQLSDDTFFLLSKAKEYAQLSGGAFDPTVGPLVSLWGIGSDEARLPDRPEILDALALIDYHNLVLNSEHRTAELLEKGMAVDLGAIAKGYAADAAAQVLKDGEVPYAIINFGGNVFAMGHRYGDGPWKIGIQDPDAERGNYIAIARVEDSAVVTSGKYERFFIQDGVRYHHILSTVDGYPIENGIASVTIVARDSTRADAFSTMLFALGPEKGLRLARETPFLQAVFVMEDKSVLTSSDPDGWLTIEDSRYHFVQDNEVTE